jgi:hypothetical protein
MSRELTSDEPDPTIVKKPKLAPSASFADVLLDMGEEEAKAGSNNNGGADLWSRPVLRTDGSNATSIGIIVPIVPYSSPLYSI